MAALRQRKHLEVLTSLLDLRGRSALDIGCGDGSLLRALLRRGLREGIGLEAALPQLERALAGEPQPGLRFMAGRGEALAFPVARFDLLLYFNALHHLPLDGMAQALAEARRVLRPDGLLYVAEPLAEGAHFTLAQPIDDETEVRRVAYARLRDAVGEGFEELCELHYDAPVRYRSFTDFRESMEAVDPGRQRLFQQREESMSAAFEALGERDDKGYRFSQPMRVNLLRPLA